MHSYADDPEPTHKVIIPTSDIFWNYFFQTIEQFLWANSNFIAIKSKFLKIFEIRDWTYQNEFAYVRLKHLSVCIYNYKVDICMVCHQNEFYNDGADFPDFKFH